MADNFILITNLICYGAIVFAVFSFVKKKRTNDEEEKMKWGKFVKISLVVFAVSVGAQCLEPENMKVKRETELAALQAAKEAQEEKKAKAKAEQEARKAKEKAEREAKAQEEAALQKKYDDQAKYEEWIAWQKQEAEKKAAKEKEQAEKERAEREKYKRASAREMLSLLAENGYAAKQKYNKELLRISNVRVSWIGPNGGGFLADSGNEFETHMFWCSVSSKTKGIELSKLRKDEYVTIYGKIDSVGEKVGERNIGGDIMGYKIIVDRIE
ncbi:MAG: hypothetical protein IJ812_02665 [Schwartzia sp.]|nr:hypothetical protein [Schwartzia sp. (in: firmicutes)]